MKVDEQQPTSAKPILSANDRIIGKPPLGVRESSANVRAEYAPRTQKSFRIHKGSQNKRGSALHSSQA